MTREGNRLHAPPLTGVRHRTHAGVLTGLVRPGNGTPVVVLHGAMADAAEWTAVVEATAPHRPALVPNRRGRHPSPGIDDDYSVHTEVEDLLSWLSRYDEPADLVGHSYGGLIALEAVRRGAAVRSLVLYEPIARPFGGEVLPKLEIALARGDLDAAVETINVDLSGYSKAHVAALRTSPVWEKLRRLARPVVRELMAIESFTFDPGSYASLQIPTTLIAGELSRHREPYGPSVDRIKDALGLDDVVVLAGHDHLAHVTGPTDLARAIEQGILRRLVDAPYRVASRTKP